MWQGTFKRQVTGQLVAILLGIGQVPCVIPLPNGIICFAAGKLTIGLAISNDSLKPGLWLANDQDLANSNALHLSSIGLHLYHNYHYQTICLKNVPFLFLWYSSVKKQLIYLILLHNIESGHIYIFCCQFFSMTVWCTPKKEKCHIITLDWSHLAFSAYEHSCSQRTILSTHLLQLPMRCSSQKRSSCFPLLQQSHGKKTSTDIISASFSTKIIHRCKQFTNWWTIPTLCIQYFQGKNLWALPITITRSYLGVLKQFLGSTP